MFRFDITLRVVIEADVHSRSQIFTDPVYGSFLFSTMSGQSRYVIMHHVCCMQWS
jgi:hypothetical protein